MPSKAIKHVQRPGLDNIYSLNSVLSSERLVLGNITLHSESRSIDPAVEKNWCKRNNIANGRNSRVIITWTRILFPVSLDASLVSSTPLQCSNSQRHVSAPSGASMRCTAPHAAVRASSSAPRCEAARITCPDQSTVASPTLPPLHGAVTVPGGGGWGRSSHITRQ